MREQDIGITGEQLKIIAMCHWFFLPIIRAMGACLPSRFVLRCIFYAKKDGHSMSLLHLFHCLPQAFNLPDCSVRTMNGWWSFPSFPLCFIMVNGAGVQSISFMFFIHPTSSPCIFWRIIFPQLSEGKKQGMSFAWRKACKSCIKCGFLL